MKTFFKITFITIIAFSLTRCSMLSTASLAGHAVGGDSELKSIAYDYETDLTTKSTLISRCLAVGEELGYTVRTQAPEMISWKTGETNRLQEYFGKYSQSSLVATIIQDESKSMPILRLSSYITGNYSEAEKTNADALILGFETKLRENLEEGHYYLKKIE